MSALVTANDAKLAQPTSGMQNDPLNVPVRPLFFMCTVVLPDRAEAEDAQIDRCGTVELELAVALHETTDAACHRAEADAQRVTRGNAELRDTARP